MNNIAKKLLSTAAVLSVLLAGCPAPESSSTQNNIHPEKEVIEVLYEGIPSRAGVDLYPVDDYPETPDMVLEQEWEDESKRITRYDVDCCTDTFQEYSFSGYDPDTKQWTTVRSNAAPIETPRPNYDTNGQTIIHEETRIVGEVCSEPNAMEGCN